jgi:dCMP deaminase
MATQIYDKAVKYMKLAEHHAGIFSKDPHTQVGCIIITSDFSRILSTGINGFPRKMNDDITERWERPEKYKYVCHAEMNAIANAARSGTSIDNSSIVVTQFPCSMCTKMLIQAGIKTIYSKAPDYNNIKWGSDAQLSESMFKEVGIHVYLLK